MRALLRAYYRLAHVVRELMKFGVVGLVAFVVDVSVFNLMLAGTDKPLTSKTVSTVVATTVSYAGNRTWTFRRRTRSGVRREYALFFLLNGVGLLIALTCLGVSHYLLGFTSRLSDNIAANVVGLAMGTTFRFWSYRRWVFKEVRGQSEGRAADERDQGTERRGQSEGRAADERDQGTERREQSEGRAADERDQGTDDQPLSADPLLPR